MNNDFYKNLGKNIKYYRKSLNITQQELADKLGISLNFMGKIEVAFSKPSLETLIKIADGFNITVSDLCRFDEKIK
jgi:transcriptional regulator with XRE-family HTH domain